MSEAMKLHIEAAPATDVVDRLRSMTRIHAEMVRRVIDESEEAPMGLGEVLEDIANTYLDISDEISAMALARRSAH